MYEYVSYFSTLRNIVSTVDLGCKLDLKKIALHARNAEYNPKVTLIRGDIDYTEATVNRKGGTGWFNNYHPRQCELQHVVTSTEKDNLKENRIAGYLLPLTTIMTARTFGGVF